MTEHGIYYPSEITGAQLDLFLAKGWYRMGQGIFTTNYVIQQDQLFRVFWLRYDLQNIQLSKNAQEITRRNAVFQITFKPLLLTSEIEELYKVYKSSLEFEPAASVNSWLMDHEATNIYNTWVVEVRDGPMLIAAGIFDLGETGIAGILNCYHPHYKKYSLGKYLMLKKIEFANARNMLWYYPGYIVKDYPRFDYKLFVDKAAAELLLPEQNTWYRYHSDLMNGSLI